VLIDTGPLVSFLDRREPQHAWVRARMRDCAAPLQTCEAVLSEAMHLLRRAPGGPESLRALLQRGLVILSVSFDLRRELAPVLTLLRAYDDLPMSLADACLVRMAELDDQAVVFTTDRDFLIYRKHGRQPVPLFFPPEE